MEILGRSALNFSILNKWMLTVKKIKLYGYLRSQLDLYRWAYVLVLYACCGIKTLHTGKIADGIISNCLSKIPDMLGRRRKRL